MAVTTFGSFAGWPAPTESPLSGCTVADFGVVVTVRIAPQAPGTEAPQPDDFGIPPHLIYYPDREPQGTGAMQEFDAGSLRLGEVVGLRPRTAFATSGPNKRLFYRIDLGCPFVATWPGQFSIAGGKTSTGAELMQDIEVTLQRPELSGTEMMVVQSEGTFSPDKLSKITRDLAEGMDLEAAVLSSGGSSAPFPRIRYSLQGMRPTEPPTMTYIGTNSLSPLEIPYGATAVMVDNSGFPVQFAVPGGYSKTVRVPAGVWMPLGYFGGVLGATFVASGDPEPPPSFGAISFRLRIA